MVVVVVVATIAASPVLFAIIVGYGQPSMALRPAAREGQRSLQSLGLSAAPTGFWPLIACMWE